MQWEHVQESPYFYFFYIKSERVEMLSEPDFSTMNLGFFKLYCQAAHQLVSFWALFTLSSQHLEGSERGERCFYFDMK
jgi:hypothetical protein